MTRNEGSRRSEINQWFLGGSVLATGVLALAACGNGNAETPPAQTVSTASISPTKSSPTKPKETAGTKKLVFDALGGGSNVINVYHGPKATPEDRTVTGTYYSGDSIDAECKTTGRTLHSHPEQNEEPRTSSDWVLVESAPGRKYFATTVYVEEPRMLLASLPGCTPEQLASVH